MAVSVVLQVIQGFKSIDRLTILANKGFQVFWLFAFSLEYDIMKGLTEQNLENQIQQSFQYPSETIILDLY